MREEIGATTGSGRHLELPPGFSDVLPEGAARLVALRERLLGVLGRWGYRPLLTPLVEYADVFTRAFPEPGDEGALHRLVDRATGHVLALRPDFTPQIARLAAARFSSAALPLRLCYEGPVVRHVPAQKGRARQLYQVGGEILGAPGPEADAETVALVIECLRRAGVGAFKVDVGQVEFFKGILAGTQLSAADSARLRDSVSRKDSSDLNKFLEGLALPDAKKRVLAELPLLAGGTEVLSRARALVESDHSQAALDNLTAVVEVLDAQGLAEFLTIDLGELRGVDYHSGIVFEAFVHHLPVALCKGGRYDRLLERYGNDVPATGFTLDLVPLLEALRLQKGPEAAPARDGVFVAGRAGDGFSVHAFLQELRGAGLRAARDLLERPPHEAVRCAAEQGYAWAVLLGEGQPGDDGERLVNLATGEGECVPLAQLSRRLAGKE